MDRIEPSAVPAGQGPESEITCSECGRPMPEITCDACHGRGQVLELRREYVKSPILRIGRYDTRIIQRDCSLCHGTGRRQPGAGLDVPPAGWDVAGVIHDLDGTDSGACAPDCSGCEIERRESGR